MSGTELILNSTNDCNLAFSIFEICVDSVQVQIDGKKMNKWMKQVRKKLQNSFCRIIFTQIEREREKDREMGEEGERQNENE